MKRSNLILNLFGLIILLVLSSCSSNSEKVIGSYSGNFNSSYPETVTINAGSGNDKVNMASTGYFNGQVLSEVSLSSSGQLVNFDYSSNSTVSLDVIDLSGSFNASNNSLSFTIIRNYGGGTSTEVFSGTKQ